MNRQELKLRLKNLAIKTAQLCIRLPQSPINRIYCYQVARSSSSSASNYRSGCRAKSKADFINKLGTVEEELDETMFFYEMLAEFNSEFKNELRELYKEANELLSIIISSITTAKRNLVKQQMHKKSAIRNPKSAI